MDGPGGGGEVDWVVGLPLGLVRVLLVGGKKPQCGERPRMELARMGGGKPKEGQLDLGEGGLFLGSSRTVLTVGGLR